MAHSNTIYHLMYGGRHYYFGSIASIYEIFTRDEFGVSIHTLWAYKIIEEHPYIGKKSEVRGGEIKRKTNKAR
ncbi:hypothetical protein HMPREF9134_00241 [Porphyromonas catoniae F0037]|uniref:Uncharacterized protein n=1 Tax=Porphyromonas catoniae F0037 TaxID=1127696 RepID=L1NHG4_9PORP|nr:hypothetical protein HMPREF9134_00241 [Porphyromonas catoniae F0037]